MNTKSTYNTQETGWYISNAFYEGSRFIFVDTEDKFIPVSHYEVKVGGITLQLEVEHPDSDLNEETTTYEDITYTLYKEDKGTGCISKGNIQDLAKASGAIANTLRLFS